MCSSTSPPARSALRGSSDTNEIVAFSGSGTLLTSGPEMHIWTDAFDSNVHRYRIDVPVNAPILTKHGPGTLVLSQRNGVTSTVNLNDGTLAAAADGARRVGSVQLFRCEVTQTCTSKARRSITERCRSNPTIRKS